MGFASLNPSYEARLSLVRHVVPMTRGSAPSAGSRVRCRRRAPVGWVERLARNPSPASSRARGFDGFRVPLNPSYEASIFTISNSTVFFVPAARCCVRVSLSSFAPAFAEAPAGMSAVALAAASPPRSEGWAERREALPLTCRARRARHHVCETRPSGANRNGPLGAPPWRCRPGNRSVPGMVCRVRGAKAPTLPGMSARPRHRAFRPRLRAAIRRHHPLRLQDRLRTTPLDERDGESLARLLFVVN